jgi:hypothetical protein
LTTTHGHTLDDCDVEFVWVLGESSGAGLFSVSNLNSNVRGLRCTIPAAPAPMMTTFFLPSLRRGLEDIVGYYHAPMQIREMDEKGFTGGGLDHRLYVIKYL